MASDMLSVLSFSSCYLFSSFKLLLPLVVCFRNKFTLADKYVWMQTTLKKVPASYIGPNENSHVSKYKMVLKRFPISLSKQPWSNIEKENLVKGIKQQYQEMLILNSMNMERYVFTLRLPFFLVYFLYLL